MTTQWLLVGMAFILSVLLAGYTFRDHYHRVTLFTSLILACAPLILLQHEPINVYGLLFYGVSIGFYSRFNRIIYVLLALALLLILSLLFYGVITDRWLWLGLCLFSFTVLLVYLIQGKTRIILWWLSVLLLAALLLLVPEWKDHVLLSALMVSLQLYCVLKVTAVIPQSESALKVSEIQAAERSRIYQNIHDDVGAELLRLVYVLDDSEQKKQVRDIMNRLRRSVAKTTQISMDANQLSDDIIDLCRQRMAEAHIEFQYEKVVDFNPVFNNTHPTGLLRIMNELLTNIIRHAKAQNVHLQVFSNHQKLAVCLSDNGCGLTHNNKTANGRGMRGLQKRAAAMGAEIIWQNKDNGGLVTRLSYPWP
jgi:signal transduction histidine kinase